jgi:hypothetical protein
MKSTRIKNWPRAERSRERLNTEGPEKLTDAELLAIILRVGIGTFKNGVLGQNASDFARVLLKEFKGIHGLNRAHIQDLHAGYVISHVGLNLWEAQIYQYQPIRPFSGLCLSSFDKRAGKVFIAMSFKNEDVLKEIGRAIDEAIDDFNKEHPNGNMIVTRADKQKGASYEIPAWIFSEIDQSRLVCRFDG